MQLKVSVETVGPVFAVAVTVPVAQAAETPRASAVAPVPNGLQKQAETEVALLQVMGVGAGIWISALPSLARP
jgi:hypothetical protein